MELKQIKELITFMSKSGTKRLAIKRGEFELELEMEGKGGNIVSEDEDFGINPMRSELDQHRVSASPSKSKDEVVTDEGTFVSSPMVGTFYRSPSPENPPFVNEGDQVVQGDVICIVEAMKVMNEVKTDVSGKIKKILIENGHPVEFGTKLFEIV